MALRLSEPSGKKIFVATAEAGDEEMKVRIDRHRRERGEDWLTIEEPLDLASAVAQHAEGIVIVDCLGLWVSNLLLAGRNEEAIHNQVIQLIEAARARRDGLIFVTNEVGWGIVPDNELARRFRDVLGNVNQMFSGAADAVILMISALPVWLKGKGAQHEFPED